MENMFLNCNSKIFSCNYYKLKNLIQKIVEIFVIPKMYCHAFEKELLDRELKMIGKM